MSIIGSIQARLGSTRLPGKCLMPIAGKPMLLRHVERLRRSLLLDDVIVATTLNPGDGPIVDLCRSNGIRFYRGSEDDVLGRLAGMIREFGVDVHVEFFGDSPLTDPHLVDEIVGFYLKHRDRYDYVSNSLKTTYPPGQEVIVYPGSVLLRADALTPKNDPLREHSSVNITRRDSEFRICGLEAPPHYRYPEIYLEVDTADDFTVITRIFEHFIGIGADHFSLAQILDFMSDNKELAELNRKVPRRWKEFREDS